MNTTNTTLQDDAMKGTLNTDSPRCNTLIYVLVNNGFNTHVLSGLIEASDYEPELYDYLRFLVRHWQGKQG